MERAVIALCRIVLIFAFGLATLGYLCRNRVGTAVFTRAIAQRRGLLCSRPDVWVGASLNYVRLAPLQCQVSDGPVRAFETGVTHLRLLRLRVRSAELESASVDYRARDVSHIRGSQATAAEPAVVAGALRQTFVRAMLDASEMYSIDAPKISVKTLTVEREGRVQLVMHGFTKSQDAGWDRSQAERVECPCDSGLVMQRLDMRVIPSWGKLRVRLRPRAHSPASELELSLEGRRLDGLKPRIVAALGPVAHDHVAAQRWRWRAAMP